MSETWTLGPWRIADRDEDDSETLTGWGPAIAAGDGPPEPDGPNRYVAEVISDNDPESFANARLIAAAPEMVELLAEIERKGFGRSWADYLDNDIRALLSRIRGEA